jgi:hypothetical protein
MTFSFVDNQLTPLDGIYKTVIVGKKDVPITSIMEWNGKCVIAKPDGLFLWEDGWIMVLQEFSAKSVKLFRKRKDSFCFCVNRKMFRFTQKEHGLILRRIEPKALKKYLN